MNDRYLYVWFRHLTTDWLARKRPTLKELAVVFAAMEGNRKIVSAANSNARDLGIVPGTTVADARVLVPGLQVIADQPELSARLLNRFALWAIQYTPFVAVDLPDGLILDMTGCAHLWGGEPNYYRAVIGKLRSMDYNARGGIASTVGAAWAWSRFGVGSPIVPPGQERVAISQMSPAALRLEPDVLLRLKKVGIRSVDQIIQQPRASLPPRFGKSLLLRLDQALGQAAEPLIPVRPIVPYQDRLPCLEPIRTATGIEIALTRLLESVCSRLKAEGKGLRSAVFMCYRVDGEIQQISIGTNRATYNINHLFKLFAEKIEQIQPDLGIEVFQLEAKKVEDHNASQETLWGGPCSIDSLSLAELLDRLTNKAGEGIIHRYLPAAHHWPERAIQPAKSLQDKPATPWPVARQRPIHQLPTPEAIEVTAPIPDYPPMSFRYRGHLHQIIKADGPERIEDEWVDTGARHRDYYAVEDQDGGRFWLFRSGHYGDPAPARWFLHGFF